MDDDYEDRMFNNDLKAAYRDTEREIFADATGNIADDPYDSDARREITDDMSQMEGIDGRPESDAEGFASTMLNGPYQHRPIESDEIAERDAYIAEQEQRIAQLEGWNKDWQETYNQAFGQGNKDKALQQLEDTFFDKYGGAFVEPEKKEQFFRDLHAAQQQTAALQQQLAARHIDELNGSLQRAFDEDPSLAQTYHDITSADPRSARMRGLAQDIYNAGPRAGEVLDSVRNDPSIRALRRSDAAPFMPASFRRPGPSRARQSRGDVVDADQSGFDDRALNDAIFDAAMED
jgi:hypothetical protein